MSTNETSTEWGPFIAKIEEEIDDLTQSLRIVCSSQKSGRKRKSQHKAYTAHVTNNDEIFSNQTDSNPREPSKSNTLSPRRKYIQESTSKKPANVSMHSNYNCFPVRRNSSARLFKPQKLELPLYQTERHVVPVLTGISMSHTGK